jgi:hypothetical protein
MVGVLVGGDEAKGHRIIARTLQRAAGKHPTGITEDQQPKQNRRVIGLLPEPRSLPVIARRSSPAITSTTNRAQ